MNVARSEAGAVKLRTAFLLKVRLCGDYVGQVIILENHLHNQLIIS